MSWICTIFRRILSCTLALLQLIHRAIPQNDIQSNFIHDSKKETNRKETISTVCRSEFKSLASGLHQRCKLYKCCHHRSSGFVSATASHFSREKILLPSCSSTVKKSFSHSGYVHAPRREYHHSYITMLH